MNKNIAVLGLEEGDEGKGRIVNYFAPEYDWVIRVGGSNNCGHVIYCNGKKYNHHLLPCADYSVKRTKSFLARGMMINLDELLTEIKTMEEDFPGVGNSIYVDPNAFVILPKHIQEDKEKNQYIASTYKGNGPATVAKFDRRGQRIYNFINDNAPVIEALKQLGVKFVPILKMQEDFEQSSLLFEGAQGILLDLQCAPYYPYCTSSDCTVSGIYSAGFHFAKIDKVYGVMKCYRTKSGNGTLITEMPKEEGDRIRELAGERGNSTGRDRRIAYADLVAAKYAIKAGGINGLILTKLDILDGQKIVKVCISYGKDIYSPADFVDLQPEYVELPGWNNSKEIMRQWNPQIHSFVKYIKTYTQTPVNFTSVGVSNEDMIEWE